MNTMISILIIVTSFTNINQNHKTGVWLEEFTVPYNEFLSKGYNITVASITGGDVPIDSRSLPTEKQAIEWKEAINALKNSVKISEIDSSKYDAVFIPGGHGAMFDLPNDLVVKNVIEDFANENKLVASVCHGPASLVNINLKDGTPFVKNKTLTSFTNSEEKIAGVYEQMPFLLETELKNKGAKFVEKANWADHIEISENLITGQNPQSTLSVAKAVIEKLEVRK